MDTRAGFEPACTVLQTATSPLGHLVDEEDVDPPTRIERATFRFVAGCSSS